MTTQTSLAATLPPEVIHAVVVHFVHRYPISTSKSGLASCSLTCRHWASIIRPGLFANIRLNSRDDLVQLLEFMITPGTIQPAIAECVQFISFFQQSIHSTPPWFHLAHMLRRFVKQDAVFSLHVINRELQAPISPSQTSDPSLSKAGASFPLSIFGLPRTLPSCISPLTMIMLDNLHVNGKDLLRLLDRLPRLWTLACMAVTFSDTWESLALYPRKLTRSLITVRLENYYTLGQVLGTGWPGLMLASTILRSAELLAIDAELWKLALGIISSLFLNNSKLRELGKITMNVSRGGSADNPACELEFGCSISEPYSAANDDENLVTHAFYTFYITFQRLYPQADSLEPGTCIKCFDFDMPYSGSLTYLNWDAFEDMLSQLDHTPDVIVRGVPDEYNPGGTMALFDSLLRGDILARTVAGGRLSLTASPFGLVGPYITTDDIRTCIATVPVEQRPASMCAALRKYGIVHLWSPFASAPSEPVTFEYIREDTDEEKVVADVQRSKIDVPPIPPAL